MRLDALSERSCSSLSKVLHRPLGAAVIVLIAYAGLSFANDTSGYLGTDTGGKVATIEAMISNGGFDPDLGYWAEAQDPDGIYHGLWFTKRFEGRWVNVSTLPMIVAAVPLYSIGGYRLALILPMLGALGAAFAAREIARRTGVGDGWPAFWVIALASPAMIYALDLWEHSLGLAMMAWGVVALLAAYEEPRWWLGALAGLAFGAAATLRTEALVYGFVAIGLTCVVALAGRRRLGPPVRLGLAAAVAGAIPLLANLLLEVSVLGAPLRSARTADRAFTGADAGASRIEEALVTFGSPYPALVQASYLAAVGLTLLICLAVARSQRPHSGLSGPLALGGVGLLYLLRAVTGLGFVPGMVAATPFAAAGLVLAWRSPAGRLAAAAVLGALPLVWAFQFRGGAGPQWGGRYILLTGLVLAAVALGKWSELAPWLRRGLTVASVGITIFGLVWLSYRSREMADLQRSLDARSEPVLVSSWAHLGREGGGFYDGDRQWLTAPFSEFRDGAAEIVAAAGYDEFAYVMSAPGDGADPEPIGDFVPVKVDEESVMGIPLWVVVYRLTDD